MWLTVAIAGLLFVGMIAILAFGYAQAEQERNGKADALLASAPAAQPGRCILCNAPLRKLGTADEVVFEVQQHIDAELRVITHLLGRTAPASYARLYQA